MNEIKENRKMKKFLTMLFGTLLVLAMVSGCGSKDGGASSAADGDTLKFGCFGYADTLDPGDQINAAWDNMRIGIGECLFNFDDTMTVQPNLCDEYSTEDHITWVFHIRDGVKFSNGNDVTPQSVIDCFEDIFGNEEGTSTPRKFIDYKTMTADNEARTLTIELNAAQPDLCKNLAYPVFMVLDTTGDYDFDTNPIGTGPYVLTSYEPKVSATLTANENYWNGEVPFKNVEVYYLGDDDAKTLALQAGDVNLVENITSAADLKMFADDDNYNVSIAQGVRCGFAYINQDGVLSDETLRHAILKAIDDDTLCETTVGGLYTAGYSVLPSALDYGYDNLTDPDPFDTDAAVKMLDDAGYVDSDGDGIREINGENISLNYITYPNRCLSDFAEAIQSTLGEIGIEVKVNSTDSDTEWNMMVNGEYDLCDSNWTTVGNGDPTEYLANWYSGYEGTDANANWCNYKNAEFDACYDALASEFDNAKRAELIQQMQQILLDDGAVLVHGYYNSSFISDTSITDANIHTADYYWLTTEIKPAS